MNPFIYTVEPPLNFGLITLFVKVALEVTKRAQHCVLPKFTRFRKSTYV